MGKIKLLDEATIHKIAAGEVIERPASVIKELVENSLDADAKNIIVETKLGGKSMMRVSDDGRGIAEEDILLAFQRHATSKLDKIDDLYDLFTLGFRGEALASIASVSKVEMITKTESAISGLKTSIHAGELIEQYSIGSPTGTTIIVRDLFYNYPVRQDFMRSESIENHYIAELMNRLALGTPQCAFKYIRDDKVVLDCHGDESIENRVYNVLGKEFVKNFNFFHRKRNHLQFQGAFSNNNLYRSGRTHQYMYVNGRSIAYNSLFSMIEKKYKTLIPINRYPCFLLYIDVPPAWIDVNIHPNKTDIKFLKPKLIFEALDTILDEILFEKLVAPDVEFSDSQVASNTIPELTELVQESAESKRIIYRDYVNTPITNYTNEIKEERSLDYQTGITVEQQNSHQLSKISESMNNKYAIDEPLNKNDDLGLIQETVLNTTIHPASSPTIHHELHDILSEARILGVAFKTYIILENLHANCLYFIDQHAAHERVLYEQYLKQFEDENVAIQQILAPESLTLTRFEKEKLLQEKEQLLRLGFEIEDFGENDIIVRGVPMLFGTPDWKILFTGILEDLKTLKNIYELKPEKIMKLACTNAVKGGDYLHDKSIKALLVSLSSCKIPNTCPHGRPTYIKLTRSEFEKLFLRIM